MIGATELNPWRANGSGITLRLLNGSYGWRNRESGLRSVSDSAAGLRS
jgi:hypothetical protein